MPVDRLFHGLLRAMLLAMPPSTRRAYAGEILALNRARREETAGIASVTRFWMRELAAGSRAILAAWRDAFVASGSQRPRSPLGGRAPRPQLLHDARFALREIRRHPGHAAVIVVTLAVGIGAVLTVFAMIDGLLLHPVPVPEPERVVRVFEALDPDSPYAATSYPMLEDYRRSELIEGPAGWITLEAGFRLGEVSDRISVGLVSGDFFEILRLAPAVGRLLQPADAEPEGPYVAVLSHELWSRNFARDPGVVGATVIISGTTFTVVGVAPPGFEGVTLQSAPDLWAPITQIREVAETSLYAAPNVLETRAFGWLSMVGRLRDGIDAPAARAELEQIARSVRSELGEEGELADTQQLVNLLALADGAAPAQREELLRFVGLLGGIVVLTLVIACLNSALLISTRTWGRDLELGIRQAIGAGRGRLIRHLLTENLALGLAGAVAGIGVALVAARVLQAFSLPGGISLARLDMTLDARLTATALALAIGSSLAFGLWPVLVQSRRDVGERLRAAGRGIVGETPGLSVMIAAQAGLSLVLLIGALLFSRTLIASLETPLGFEPDGVAAISFAFQGHGYDADETLVALRTILDGLGGSPAVGSVAVASHVPLAPPRARLRPFPEQQTDGWEAQTISVNTVSADYFATLRIPLVAGRTFGPQDTPAADDVAVINRAAARILFAGEPPLGRRMALMRGLPFIEVVGVVDDHKVHSIEDEQVPYVYLSASQTSLSLATGTHLVARATGPTADAIETLRNAVRELDPALPVYDARLIASQMDQVLMPQRFGALLLGSLAAVTLAMSAVGVYAMVAFGVRRRTRELGVRMVLGATPRRLLLESTARTSASIVVGIVVGTAVAVALLRFVDGYLYGIESLDAVSFAGAPLLLAVVSLAAALRPALRAARIEPDVAIRQGR